jgi:hypothetical protein
MTPLTAFQLAWFCLVILLSVMWELKHFYFFMPSFRIRSMFMIKNYPSLSYTLIRKSSTARKTGDIEVCLDYGSKRIEIWKVISHAGFGKTSVYIKRWAIGLPLGFYKMNGSLMKEAA